MAYEIRFICSECSEDFIEKVQSFVDEPGHTINAPVLCQDCGCPDPNDD